MKISLHWLSDLIDLQETNPDVLARRLTASVGEVEDVDVQGELLQNCCVGKILSLDKHPNADRLSVCLVETDHGSKTVVCGGTNLRAGMRIAFAHVGARVRHGKDLVTLEQVNIRGVDSEGMICAAEELDLADRFPPAPGTGDRPIVDLGDGDEQVGQSMKEFLGLTDVIFHIDNHAITHRADLFSHMGIARELTALGLATWKKQPRKKSLPFTKDPLPFVCKNEIKDLVPRYCACMLEIKELGETPQWMKKRLEATGWRSVNLPVDITNYVTMELGMPLHSFDADDLKGDVRIRLSQAGESIRTLDEVSRQLPEGAVVLSDDAGIFDLLGIMGGLRSSTKETTRRIYLHAAAVDPVAIRRAILATGHRTDAGTIYEKGIPRVVVQQGFLRALELFLAHVPGARITSMMESWGDDGTPRTIELPYARVGQMLGTDIPVDRAVHILKSLDCTVKTSRGKAPVLTVTIPLHRLGDLKGEHDLIEEIGRIHGYDAIEPVLPSATVTPPPRDPRVHQLRDTLKESGYVEITPLSLLGSKLLERAQMRTDDAIRLKNPIGEETSLLQPSVLPGLLEHAQRNGALAKGLLRTFTIAHVFSKKEEKIDEHAELGLLLSSDQSHPDLHDHPFLLLKREVMEMLQALGYTCDVVPSSVPPPFAHPGQCAEVQVLGQPLGWLCMVHPSVTERFGLGSAAVCLLHFDALLERKGKPVIATVLPSFPAVSYDETITLDSKRSAGELLQKLQGKSPLLESIAIVDLYQGSDKKNGSYSLTLRFTYRSPERTLTEEEAKREHGEVMKAAKN